MKNLLPALLLLSLALSAQPPRYKVEPPGPKLPEDWVFGRLGGVCVDSHDHVAVVDRRDITKEEEETSHHAPPIVIFDQAGSVIRSIGDPNRCPLRSTDASSIKRTTSGSAGNDDGIIQKYSHDGKLLLQIGKRGAFDTSDGTRKGKALNASHDQFFLPAGIAIDPGNGDIYVADGYGNRRVAVFDKTGKFLRQWGRQGHGRRDPGGRARGIRAVRTLHRHWQRRTGVCVRPAGRSHAGVRQSGELQAQHLDQEWDARICPIRAARSGGSRFPSIPSRNTCT